MIKPDFVSFLKQEYPEGRWPSPFHILEGLEKVKAGKTVNDAAREVKTTPAKIQEFLKSTTPAFKLIGVKPSDLTDQDMQEARLILGQLLIGRAAELAFEDIYASEMRTESDYKLVNVLAGRTGTDYRVLNGKDRPIYRINVKFFGSLFRDSERMVGLISEDCFPLATYKIFSALEKQEQEFLPYFFAVSCVPNLTAVSIQGQLPPDEVAIVAMVSKSARLSGQKRSMEEKVVERVVKRGEKAFVEIFSSVRGTEWRIISARKAY
jgi:predicted nucleic acid-binding OB-fold protein